MTFTITTTPLSGAFCQKYNKSGEIVPKLCCFILTIISIEISFLSSYIRPHKMSGVTSSFIGSVQQVFVNGKPLSLYGADTAKCAIVQDEDRLPCATTGVTRYTGPPCGEGKSCEYCAHSCSCFVWIYRCIEY